jgi:hypothetical protein
MDYDAPIDAAVEDAVLDNAGQPSPAVWELDILG